MPLSISAYFRSHLAGDLAGGGAAALIALPYGLAMANMMGFAAGTWPGHFSGDCTDYNDSGRNPLLIGGAASATVPFIGRATAAHGVAGAAEICLLAALLMLLLGSLKLGRQIPQSSPTCRYWFLLWHRRHDGAVAIRSDSGRQNGHRPNIE